MTILKINDIELSLTKLYTGGEKGDENNVQHSIKSNRIKYTFGI